MYTSARLGVVWILAAVMSASCIVVPWFPSNPYSPEKIKFLNVENVSREQVVSNLGSPWANLDEQVFVYLARKNSAHIIMGGSDSTGDIPVNRDYFLVVDFTEAGTVDGYETYTDSLRHDHCFKDGICLASKTFNIPLAPPQFDARAKRFEGLPEACVVYVYRDDSGVGLADHGYMDIHYHRIGGPLRRIATSVEHGFFRFTFRAPQQLELQVKSPPPMADIHGPLANEPPREQKPRAYRNLFCEAGEIDYFRLYVPERNSRPIEFQSVEPEVAQEKVAEMKLLLERRTFPEEALASGIPVQ